TESVLVSLVGGLLGLLFAACLTRLVVALMPSFNVPNEARIEINVYVLMFCVIISAFTGILFGLIPALQSSRPDLVEALKDEARSGSASAGKRTRALLVVAEVAFSVVLLVSAGLTIRSFIALDRKSTRLNSSHVAISYAVFCLKKKTPTHPAASSSPSTASRGFARRFPSGPT